jgi:hypothetical protein
VADGRAEDELEQFFVVVVVF